MTWGGEPAWPQLPRRRAHDRQRWPRTHPGEVDGYRRYLEAALPAVRLILDAANEPPSLRGLAAQGARASAAAGVATLLRWSRRSAADVLRAFFTREALLAPGDGRRADGVGHLPGDARHRPRRADLRDAPRRHVGRPVGGSGHGAGGAARGVRGASAARCARARRVDGDPLRGRPASRGVVLDDGTEITAGVVVSACNPHDTFLEWLRNPPPQADDARRAGGGRRRTRDGYESKIDAIVDSARRRCARARRRIGRRDRVDARSSPRRSPTSHRGYEMMGRGRDPATSPALLVNVPTRRSTRRWRPAGGQHVFSLEVLYTPYARPRRLGRRDRAAAVAASSSPTLVEPGFLESLGEWRAMTPDRYEREFHLPAGHATSFAGGPLAALRNKDPELTRYETPVPGLYLTGAATFPGAGVWGASGRNAAPTVLLRQRTRDPQRERQASLTAQARLATGSLSLHGKLIHWSVRFHT